MLADLAVGDGLNELALVELDADAVLGLDGGYLLPLEGEALVGLSKSLRASGKQAQDLFTVVELVGGEEKVINIHQDDAKQLP